MFENPRRGRQARNFTTNTTKILDLKSSSEQIFSRKLPLGAPDKIRYMASRNEYSKKRLGEISTAAYNTSLENTNYGNRYSN